MDSLFTEVMGHEHLKFFSGHKPLNDISPEELWAQEESLDEYWHQFVLLAEEHGEYRKRFSIWKMV
jgi:hypothetical protein